MGFFARILMMALMIGGVAFVLYQIVIFLIGVQPSKTALKRDLKLIRNVLDKLSADLIPWEVDDLQLLSRDKSVIVKRSGLNKIVSGVVQSIYYEPMLAYGFKTFSRDNKIGLLVIRSYSDEFIYQYAQNGVEVFKGDQHVGTICLDLKMWDTKSSKLLARIQDGLELKPVFVGTREVAVIKETTISKDLAGRYFEYVDNVNNQESTLLLALSLYELVTSDLS